MTATMVMAVSATAAATSSTHDISPCTPKWNLSLPASRSVATAEITTADRSRKKCSNEQKMAPLYALVSPRKSQKVHPTDTTATTSPTAFTCKVFGDITPTVATTSSAISPSRQRRRNSTDNCTNDVLMLPPLSPKKQRKGKEQRVSSTTQKQLLCQSQLQSPSPSSEACKLWGASPVRSKKATAKPSTKRYTPPASFATNPNGGASYTLHVAKPTSVLRHSQSLPVSLKAVSFASKDCIKEIETVADFAVDEIAAMWWSSREYTEIKRDYEAVVHLMETKAIRHDTHDDDESGHCTRGLHQRTEQGAWRLYERQRNARNAVLAEQERYQYPTRRRRRRSMDQSQSSSSSSSPQPVDMALEIAKAYWMETMPMREEALQTAADDAAAIQSYLECTNGKRPTATATLRKQPRRSSCSEVMSGNAKDPKDVACVRCPAPQAKFHDSITHLQTRKKAAKQQISTSHVDLLDEMIQPDETEAPKTQTATPRFSLKSAGAGTICSARPRSVHFSETIDTIPGRAVSDVEKDTKRRWYSRKELGKLQVEVNATIQRMEQQGSDGETSGTTDELGNDASRGLEKNTSRGAAFVSERRSAAIRVVLDTQMEQRTVKANGDECQWQEHLADVYIQATKEAGKEAVKTGKQDAKEAKKYRLRRRSTKDKASLSSDCSSSLLLEAIASADDSEKISNDLDSPAAVASTNMRRASCTDISNSQHKVTELERDDNHRATDVENLETMQSHYDVSKAIAVMAAVAGATGLVWDDANEMANAAEAPAKMIQVENSTATVAVGDQSGEPKFRVPALDDDTSGIVKTPICSNIAIGAEMRSTDIAVSPLPR